MSLGEGLNPEQREFVFSDKRRILALAGPGSGKTRCLTHRVARLMQSGVGPEKIMLTTFTNRAADEIKDRVRELVGERAETITAGTFHSLGFRFLRKYHRDVGLEENYRILNDRDAKILMSELRKEIRFLENGPKDSLRYFTDDRVHSVLGLARNTGGDFFSLLERMYPDHSDIADEFERLAEAYRRLKLAMNVCDFDDLLVYWLSILEDNKSALADARSRWEHILVDEYQDTNVVQSKIIDLMAEESALAVVGDIDQSIYKFRGAEVKNMLEFERRHPGTYIIRLAENYRSSPSILHVANSLIRNNDDRIDMTLRTQNEDAGLPTWYEFQNPMEEAEWMAERLDAHRREPSKSVAVLYRSSYVAGFLELEMISRKIPYEIFGGQTILARRHIDNAICWLRVFGDRDDAYAWRKVLFFYKGSPDDTYINLWEQIRDSKEPLLDILSGNITPQGGLDKEWNKMRSSLGDMMVAGMKPGRMLRALLSDAFIEQMELEYDDAEDRISDIEGLAFYADRFKTLREFLMAMEDNSNSKEEGIDTNIHFVTIHSSKGREYDSVYILGCNEGITPSKRAVSDSDVNEERRLFYVAITRARQKLFFASCREAKRQGGSIDLKPSRFLEELPEDSYALICL